jgi:hypothetical protein
VCVSVFVIYGVVFAIICMPFIFMYCYLFVFLLFVVVLVISIFAGIGI